MEQIRLYANDLLYLLPELSLVITAILLSVVDMFLPKVWKKSIIGWLSLIGIIVSAVFVVMSLNPEQTIQLLNQSYRIDDFSNILKLILLLGTGLVILMSLGYEKEEEITNLGEYYYFLLPAVLGGMIMSSSGDLITLFVGLELLSITSYLLVAINKKNRDSNESAFKYLVMGGISSAIILYGMSFLYGISGSTNIAVISEAINNDFENYQGFIYLSFFMIIAGFGFKIAAAPFHNWAPDVYQGAYTPVSAFLAVVSKIAGFAILFRVIYSLLATSNIENLTKDVTLTLSILAASAMVIGNVLALNQKNTKRLLAYSGVANAGYLLVPLGIYFSMTHSGNFSEFIYYAIAYLFMNIGAFAVFMIIERSSGEQEIRGFAGLYYRAPYTATAMVLIILSLAGIPVTGGFFGKFYILLGTMQTQTYWLGAVMIASSVISFYYYFSIVRQMFMRADFDNREVKVPYPLGITVWICALVSVGMGMFPQAILSYIHDIFTIVDDLFVR